MIDSETLFQIIAGWIILLVIFYLAIYFTAIVIIVILASGWTFIAWLIGNLIFNEFG